MSRLGFTIGVTLARFASLDQIKKNSLTEFLREALWYKPATQGAVPLYRGAPDDKGRGEMVR